MFVTILVPVLERPQHVTPLLASIVENTPRGEVEVLFITDETCKVEIGVIAQNQISLLDILPTTLLIAPMEVHSWSQRINYGIRESKGTPWVFCGADDIRFHPKWLEEAQYVMREPGGPLGIVGTNDLGHWGTQEGWHSTHFLANRRYIEEHGTIDGEKGKLLHEGYRHNFTDNECNATAQKRGMRRHAFKCHVEHMHPSWGKGAPDAVYGHGGEHWGDDRALWDARRAKFML